MVVAATTIYPEKKINAAGRSSPTGHTQKKRKKEKKRMNAVGFIATAIWCKKLGVCMKFCHLLEFAMIAGFVGRKDREKFSSKISCRTFSWPFHKTTTEKKGDKRQIIGSRLHAISYLFQEIHCHTIELSSKTSLCAQEDKI